MQFAAGRLAGLVEVNGNCFGDTLLFHGYAVEGVGESHGFLIVGDDDELRVDGHFLEHFLETDYVGLVQRGIYFIEQAEGAGSDFKYREHQGDGGHGFFPTRHQGQALQAFA